MLMFVVIVFTNIRGCDTVVIDNHFLCICAACMVSFQRHFYLGEASCQVPSNDAVNGSYLLPLRVRVIGCDL